MTRITGRHPRARGPERRNSTRVAPASSIKNLGRTGRAATGVATVALAASAALAGIAGSAAATTGPPRVTTPVTAPHIPTTAPGRMEFTATSNYNSKNVKTVAVDCPAGLDVVGTGYFVKTTNAAIEITSLVPTPASAPTSVQLRAVEVTPFAGKWEVIVKAVCGDVDTTVSAAKTGFNSAGAKNKTAGCSGSRVIGTGYFLREPTTPTPVIGSMRIDPSLLTVSINASEAFPTAANWSLTALAICSPDLGQTLVTATEPPPPNSNTQKVVDAICPAGTETTGAGFDTGANGQVIATDLNPAPLEAETIGYEDQPYAFDWTLKTYAICV